MIKVSYTNKKLEISGHANYNKYGTDIVCASVSSLINASVNQMHVVDSDAFTYTDDGNKIIINIIKDNSLINKMLNVLLELLINLSKDYPNNIKVESEE